MMIIDCCFVDVVGCSQSDYDPVLSLSSYSARLGHDDHELRH